MGNIEKWLSQLAEMSMTYGLKLFYAIIILLLGLWLCRIITNSISRLMDKREIEISIRPFMKTIINITLKIVVIMSAAGMMGVEMSSLVAMLGAAGFAIGMALSGTLQNFAGGVIILIIKPFKVGDFIEAQSHMGTVDEIQIFNTYLTTPDNKVIILPNGGLATGSIINYSRKATRRIDLLFGISYSDNIDKARDVIQNIIDTHEDILKDPLNLIAVKELANSSVNIVVKIWVKTENYWPVFYYMQEHVKKAFDNNEISIPFPQTDIHLHNSLVNSLQQSSIAHEDLLKSKGNN